MSTDDGENLDDGTSRGGLASSVDSDVSEEAAHGHLLWGGRELQLSSTSGSQKNDCLVDGAVKTFPSHSSSDQSPVATSGRGACDLHAQGACTPCRFVTSVAGCRRAQACSFCHEPHGHLETQPRPNRSMRLKVKRIVNSLLQDASLEALVQSPPDGTHQSVSERYFQGVLRIRQRKLSALAAAATGGDPAASTSSSSRQEHATQGGERLAQRHV
eukprot:NODE_2700_length_892_cov_17.713262.p1 GENE.NODE_2700_length_892_cov_17.713262~~NODE_2700_length_892_cov_17.713262.p1  ORF type:complete len:215 (-),score=19.16 NODE_2700_length_892_cov_17.713262:116-760(-)